MLQELYVKNFALIEEVRLTLGTGFSVVSGETGAGKSLFVGAIGLLLGDKASPALIRTGEKESIIEGVFDVHNRKAVHSLLEEWGFSDDDSLLIRRHISAEGKNRIYINGCTATLAQLQRITSEIIDLSGQHEQQVLLKEENHRRLLDSVNPEFLEGKKAKKTTLVKIEPFLEQYRSVYSRYQAASQELRALKETQKNKAERLEFIRFQAQEIEKANIIDVEEEDKLLLEKTRVKNADFLHELVSSTEETLLSGDDSIRNQLERLLMRSEKALRADASLEEGFKYLQLLRDPLEDAGRFFSRYAQELNVEPGRLETIEARLYQIHQLRKKYGTTLAEIKAKGETLRQELNLLENYDENLAEQEEKLQKIGVELAKAAASLSEARRQLAGLLEKAIKAELTDLAMPSVVFNVIIETPLKPSAEQCGPEGFDAVRFEMSANVGEKPRPLAKIASGGELSRILLAIKKILGRRAQPVTYIFDEIDTGVGGAVAEVVGRKLREISESSQVLCVTHLPQIASFADEHFIISKDMEDKRTRTEIRRLHQENDREQEIARMLGGLKITDKTREHAREMLQSARQVH